jgi:hypothetical protein
MTLYTMPSFSITKDELYLLLLMSQRKNKIIGDLKEDEILENQRAIMLVK